MKGKEGDLSSKSTKIEDIKKLGSELHKIRCVNEMEEMKDDEKYYFLFKTLIDKAKYVLTAPIQRVPMHIFKATGELMNSTIQLPDQYKVGFAIRHVVAATIIKKHHDLYKSNYFQEQVKKSPSIFSIPYLLLCINTHNPIDTQFSLPHDGRSRCMQLYYSGVNLLLLHKFKLARDNLMRAKTYTRDAHEMVSSIVDMLSLACFLNGDQFEIFNAFSSPKVQMASWARDLWDLKISDKLSSVPNKLISDIEFECAVRFLTQTAQTSTRAPVNYLKDLCGGYFEKALHETAARGIVKIEINEGIASFTELLITDKLLTEAAEVTELLNAHKKK